jgi:ComF family protein
VVDKRGWLCSEYIGAPPKPLHTMLTRLLAHAARALPSQCAVCRSWGVQQVCPACTSRFSIPTPRCATCALPLAGSASQCGECLLHTSALDACLAAVDYGYPWDGLLAQLKFKGQHGAGADAAVARALANTMRPLAAIQTALRDADFIVPIPLSPARLRQRGFNQALEISKHLLRPSPDRPAIASAKLHPQLLLRIRDTTAQTGLPRAERLRNMRHAFAVEPLHAARLRGASVVLVDDVTTTTATLCAAALALRSAGAARVVGVVFARTPAPG